MIPKNCRGVTLTELMIAVVIVTVGVLGLMGSFKFITKAISNSRLKTIAVNLAQEKMEVLKNKPYFQLLVTTYSATSVGYTPNFIYDNANYPPETITLWGLPPMTRVVNVDYASASGTSISTLSYTANDTGMKKITVYVYWTEQGTNKKVQLDNYYQNPSVATLSTGFRGQVTIAGGGALNGALVQVIGTPKWRSYSDSSGNYSFQVAPGSYTLVCSTPGFFSQSTNQLSVSEGIYTPSDFSLTRIASGTVAADSVYTRNPSLVISQVVASTVVPNGYDVQYVELFNPTTAPINIGSGGSHLVQLNFTSKFQNQVCNDIGLTYVSTYAAPGKYYLMANTNTFVLGGANSSADAYYTDTANSNCSVANPTGFTWNPPTARPILMHGHSGTVWLTDSSGATLDATGWTSGGNTPDNCETSCISFSGGLLRGDQIVRFSTACAVGSTYGRVYDSGNNSNDFYYNNTGSAVGVPYGLFSSASAAPTVLSGNPALSAYILVNDGNSAGILSSNSAVPGPQGQSCPISSFTLVGVATGTWKLTAVSGSYTQMVSNVVSTQGVTTKVTSAATAPAWPAAGFNHVAVTSTYTGGFASGYVYGGGADYWTRLNSILVGSSAGGTTRTDSQGFYLLSLATGTATITANYNMDNGNYISSDYDAVIMQGAVTSIPDFHIAQGGYIKGYVTAGTGALPNIVVQATNGGSVMQDSSDSTGYFYIFVSTSATPYTITPDLDPLQSSTSLPVDPLTATVTVPGSTVMAGTITVVGALGTITGTVKVNGALITTGVLIMASTAAISSPPATIYASSAPAQAAIYSISSQADGTYSLEVRSSTSTAYNMRAFYPVINDTAGTVSYTSKTQAGVSVSAGATVTQDFTWP